MWSGLAAGVLALVVATQAAIGARACSDGAPMPQPAPQPAPAPGPTPGDIFTTGDGIRFSVQTVVTNLDVPWAMAFAPDGRLFVTERGGRVRILSLAASTSQLALTIDGLFGQGEAGALGLALDPDFALNSWVYLYYTAAVGSGGAVNRVVRYREVGGRLTERIVLLDNIPGAVIHDGGRLRFGPDGLLYVTTGDANQATLAQDLASLAGKILRITRDGTSPRDNPFGSPVLSAGHRNPQGLDWHPVSGELWASEHGPTGNDEINRIRAGGNYGWPRIEGAAVLPGMEPPVVFYNPAIAPSGASFYRGGRIPGFTNDLFVGTLRGMHLLRLRTDGDRVLAHEALLDDRYGRIRDVVSGPDGYLYIATNNRDGRGSPTATDDRILRLVPSN